VVLVLVLVGLKIFSNGFSWGCSASLQLIGPQIHDTGRR
jgi:hypothetical protein